MENPQYNTVMMLNPVECAIHDFYKPSRSLNMDERPLVPASTRHSSSLVPKRKFSISLWFFITLSTVAGWFSFITSIPALHLYYDRKLLEISMLFWISPLFMAIMTPLISTLISKRGNILLSLMLAGFANALGCAVKCKGISRNGYFIILGGQVITACAVSLSFGFFLSFCKEHQSKVRLMTSLGIISVALGSIIGCMAPLFVLRDRESLENTGSDLYTYFIWHAIFSTVNLILIPFALKEQRQRLSTDYQTYVIHEAKAEHVPEVRNSFEAGQSPEADQLSETEVTVNSHTNVIRNIRNIVSHSTDKRIMKKLTACALNYGVFLSFFPASMICFSNHTTTTRMIGLAESAVIPTTLFFFVFNRTLKNECPKWLIGLCELLFIAMILTFTYCLDSGSSTSKISSFFSLHSVSGFLFFLSLQKLKRSVTFSSQLMIAFFFLNLPASIVSFLLLFLLWKVAVFGWAVALCIISFVSSIILIFSQ